MIDVSYPRPQMKRELFQPLMEGWKLNGKPIRLPFPPEASLSGYDGPLGDDFFYETVFVLDDELRKRGGDRLLLHFGAVDQIAKVYVNGVFLGSHEGGYLPFSFDITDVVKWEGENLLEVKARDALDQTYPWGKQSRNPKSMWYTCVSGIWQMVFIEPVPQDYIETLRLTPDLQGVRIRLRLPGGKVPESFSVAISGEGAAGGTELPGILTEQSFSGGDGYLKMPDPHLWTPEDPWLYRLRIRMGKDVVQSYVGLRSFESRTENGIPGVFLNGKRIFLHGVLDQGYYDGGLYTVPEPEEYERDVRRMKNLGFNFLRKHIKVEPDIFYYVCDVCGMLVMQDMVNSGNYRFLPDTVLPTFLIKRSPRRYFGVDEKKRRAVFIREMKRTAAFVYNHPSVIAYTIFNEGWGQFSEDKAYRLLKKLDKTRLVDTASGWFAGKESDFDSLHIYYRNEKLKPDVRPFLLSECGGYGLEIEGHMDGKRKTQSYKSCRSRKDLTEQLLVMYREMVLPAIPKGLCGSVLTQLSDVEGEINGLYTYDREVLKVYPEEMRAISRELMESVSQI